MGPTKIPRKAAVAGSVGSEQNDGIETANGLKFFSAWTRAFAASRAPAPVKAATWSASESYQGISFILDMFILLYEPWHRRLHQRGESRWKHPLELRLVRCYRQ